MMRRFFNTVIAQSLVKETQVYRLARKQRGRPDLVFVGFLRDDHKHSVEIQSANG